MKIAIDPGHGSNTAGKRTPPFPDGSVMKENEFNEAVAALLAVELQKQGFETIQVAPEQEDTPLPTRADRANLAKADLYISIHANAFGGDWNNAQGIETFVYNLSDQQTVSIAKAIQSSLVAATGRADRGVKENPSLYVLHATTMPAVLVECGFMTHVAEAKLLRDMAYRRTVARAICKGVCRYYDVPYQDSITEKTKVIIDGKEYQMERILINGTNYIKIRDIANALGYDVTSKGSIAILTKK